MEMALSVFAAVVSMLALLVALMVHGELQGMKGAPKQSAETKKRSGRARDRPVLTDADRRKQAVAKREHRNFMEYDGTPQIPIDESTILADSDEPERSQTAFLADRFNRFA